MPAKSGFFFKSSMYKLILKPLFFLFDPEFVHHTVFKLIKISNKIPGISKLIRSIYVVKDKRHLDSEVLKIMNKVNKCSPNGIAVTKNLLNSNYNIDTTHAAKLFAECIVNEEGREGFASFFEKRKPFWNKKDYK